MAANALVQTRIDPEIKERATEILDNIGLSVSDVMRIVLTRVAKEGALPAGLTVDAAAYDAWFRAKVQEALNDPRPAVPHEEVESYFSKRRAAARREAGADGA
ncbi:type II toxin-antitoxin system RelB family antitoxin [Variovorax sp. 22077]|jgi:DNA-damage-inducible protein J|uniref:type II toxin-antitoxin system RelB family antitoxin n=1 Tax=Variovorax sp. 22077 TaxID=3453867 RepID=UPI003F870E54